MAKPWHAERERDDAQHALRLVGGELDRPPHAVDAQADEHRPRRAGRVEDGREVADEPVVAYAAGSIGRSDRPLPRPS